MMWASTCQGGRGNQRLPLRAFYSKIPKMAKAFPCRGLRHIYRTWFWFGAGSSLTSEEVQDHGQAGSLTEEQLHSGSLPGQALLTLGDFAPHSQSSALTLHILFSPDFVESMLSHRKGAAFLPHISQGMLGAYQELCIDITGCANMWGEYWDELLCVVRMCVWAHRFLVSSLPAVSHSLSRHSCCQVLPLTSSTDSEVKAGMLQTGGSPCVAEPSGSPCWAGQAGKNSMEERGSNSYPGPLPRPRSLHFIIC